MTDKKYINFYKEIICKKSFYIPVILFALIGYSFSIYNRTIGLDDMFRHVILEHGGATGRWGGIITYNLLGLTSLDPFIDRFLAILLLTLSAILFCYILYSINSQEEVLTYTITTSTFITYPLINEIWEYTTANWTTGSDLCLVTLAFILLRTQKIIFPKFLLAGLLLVIPITTYEISIFYYITLVFIVMLYELIANNYYSYKVLAKNTFIYLFPIFIALVIRLVVTFFIKIVYTFPYANDLGDTHITWLSYSFIPTLKGLIFSNFIHYTIYGLVYFPIAVFVLCVAIFFILILKNKIDFIKVIILGILTFVSLFAQAIIQGDLLAYRHTIAITLFVAFVAYLSCISVNKKWKIYVYILFFFLCWHQAVYLNKIFGLNNLRSDNELATIRYLGHRLTSDYQRKPVVFVGEYQKGKWILSKISANEDTWNGRLFYLVCNALGEKHNIPLKYVDTNINNATLEYYQIEEILNHCGFNIDVIPKRSFGKRDNNAEELYKEATLIAKQKMLRPYQIYDNDSYLIVNLGKIDSKIQNQILK